MTLPVLKLKVPINFPSRVIGTTGISVAKANGIFTIELDYTGVAQIPSGADPLTILVLVYDPVAKIFYQAPLTNLGIISAGSIRIITAAGNQAVGPTDGVIAFRQTVAQTVNLLLPAAASRGGLPLSVEDLAGAAAANPITIIPNGAETIDGLASVQLANAYSFIKLRPYSGIGWKMI